MEHSWSTWRAEMGSPGLRLRANSKASSYSDLQTHRGGAVKGATPHQGQHPVKGYTQSV